MVSKAAKKPSKKTPKQSASKPKKATGGKKRASTARKAAASKPLKGPLEKRTLLDRLADLSGVIAQSAVILASKTTGVSKQVGKQLVLGAEQQKVLIEAGASLKDLRQVAGLTISDLSKALKLKDQSLLEAVESGTAVLSFELILRLSALLARHDPLPFIMKYTRTYNPEIWRLLDDWGMAQLPLQIERERQFVNILRGCDTARELSDEAFAKVLAFTQAAFDLALEFSTSSQAVSGKGSGRS
jgi:transcriptional regulator with XRE-family HTH domain